VSQEDIVKVAYFPGCTLKTKAKGLDDSVVDTARALGYDFEEVPDWTCCGATFDLSDDNVMSLAPPVRILANARQIGREVVTVCAGCYNVLKRANHTVRTDPEKLKKITDFIELEYDGETEVIHYLEFLRDRVGFEALSKTVRKDLSNLKVVPYYGCQLLRPHEEVLLDDPENPVIMDDMLRAIGCDVLGFPHKAECCGAFLTVCSNLEARRAERGDRPDNAVPDCSYLIVNSAGRRGADLIVLSCPLCQYNIDFSQERLIREHYGFKQVPSVYFSQLLALALGLDIDKYSFDEKHHFVDPRGIIEEKVLTQREVA
jgi:heterodisulfide reductase subunit B